MSGSGAIALIAWREIRERTRSEAFLASTLVLLALVGGSAVLGRMFDPTTTYRVAVTEPAPAGLGPALRRAAEPFDDANVQLRVVASPAAGRQALEAEEVDALLLLSEDRLVFRADVDARAAAVADSAVRALRRHLPPAPELTTTTLHPPDEEATDAAILVAYVGSLLLLTSLAFYGQWVVTGVVEEKNNRVVELILSTVRARHLLAGKVIGIGCWDSLNSRSWPGWRRRWSSRGSSTRRPSSAATSRSSSPGSRSGSRSTRWPMRPRARWPRDSRTPTPQGSPSRTRSSACTSPATSPSRAPRTAFSRTR